MHAHRTAQLMTHRLGNGRNEIMEIFPHFAQLLKEFGLNTSFSKENSEPALFD
jgi:hypothetical protein